MTLRKEQSNASVPARQVVVTSEFSYIIMLDSCWIMFWIPDSCWIMLDSCWISYIIMLELPKKKMLVRSNIITFTVVLY